MELGLEPRLVGLQSLCSFMYSTLPTSMRSHLINIKLENRKGRHTERVKGQISKNCQESQRLSAYLYLVSIRKEHRNKAQAGHYLL